MLLLFSNGSIDFDLGCGGGGGRSGTWANEEGVGEGESDDVPDEQLSEFKLLLLLVYK